MKKTSLYCFSCLLFLSACFEHQDKKGKTDPEQLTLLWDFSYVPTWAPIIRPTLVNDRILFSGDTRLTALNITDGEVIWSQDLNSHHGVWSKNLVITGNQIFGIVMRNNVPSIKEAISWDLNTGEELWRNAFEDSVSLSQWRYNTGSEDSYIAHAENRKIVQMNLDGSLKKVFNHEHTVYNMSVHDNLLFLGQGFSEDDGWISYGKVSVLNLETWQKEWEYTIKNHGGVNQAVPILENGIIYAGTTNGPRQPEQAFFALDAQTGEELWRQEGIFTYSAVLVDDYIYIHDASGIYKLHKSDGEIAWYSDFHAGNGTAPIDYGYGYLYAPHSGIMHIVDAETGEIVHRFSPPDGSYFWKVTVGAGRIFAQSNRKLYAFAPWGHTEPLKE